VGKRTYKCFLETLLTFSTLDGIENALKQDLESHIKSEYTSSVIYSEILVNAEKAHQSSSG